jgi:hypothetical protein
MHEKYRSASTITPLHHSTKYGDLLAAAKRNEANFTYHGRHPSLTSTQFTHIIEFTWGVHTTPTSSLGTKLSNAQCIVNSLATVIW